MTSPSFLPALQADETIYSWCATAHTMSGWRATEGWSLHMLNAAHSTRQHVFPAYLPALLNNHLTQVSVERALRQHSIVGMFWPFVPSAFSEHLLSSNPEAQTAWHYPAHYVGRIMLCNSRTLPWDSALRYCPVCIDADQSSIGRAYWHVAHQWPVSRHCTTHGRPLIRAKPSRKTWQLPSCDDRNQLPPDDDGYYEVSSVVQRLAQTLCQLDSIDLALLRQATLKRLCALGVIHSTYSVRHTRLDQWYCEQPISRWCVLAGGGMEQFATSAWLPKLLWRRTQDHPIRWIIAWASLEWPSSEYAAQALLDSQRSEPLEDGGQLTLFKPTASSETPAQQHPSPVAFQQALATETSYTGLMARLGVTRGDIVRWLEASPDAREAWRNRLQTLRIAEAENQIRQCLQQRPEISRQEVNKVLGRAIRLMRQHVPDQLNQILAAVPARLDVQRSLFHST